MVPVISRDRLRFVLIFLSLISVLCIAAYRPAQAQSCTAPSTDLGTVTESLTIPSAGTYRLWSNMLAPDASDNSYLFEIDGAGAAACYDIGGAAMAPQAWTWVDDQDGNVNLPADINIPAAGQYTVKLIGNAPGVQLDRVILTQDTSCVPTGTGDNCANPPDTTPPTVSLVSPKAGATINGTSLLSALASDDTGVASVSFYVDGSGVPVATVNTPGGTTSTSPQTYSYSFDTSALSNGGHELQARATDTSGNVGSSPTINVTVDNVSVPGCAPPSAPTDVTETMSTVTTIGFSWSASTPGGKCTLTGYKVYRNGILLNAAPVTSASYTDTGLSAGTTYDYGVEAVDSDQGVSAMSASVGLSTAVDNIPPTVSVAKPLDGATVSGTTDISGTATDNVDVASVVIEVDGSIVDTVRFPAASQSDNFGYNWDTTGLTNGTHSIDVIAYDEAGNAGTQVTTVTVKNGDTQPPTVPTGVTASAPSFNRVNLTWNASTDNVGVTGYYVLRNGSTIAKLNAVTAYTDDSVAESTTYAYRLMAFDAAGNVSGLSATATVTTPKARDTVPPSVPTGLKAVAANSNQIDLTWNASTDNVGVASYDIYRSIGGTRRCVVSVASSCPVQLIQSAIVRIASGVTSTSYGDNGLKAATTYTYYVAAVDTAGNMSKRSVPASATTYQSVPPTGVTTGIVDGTVLHTGTGFTAADIRYTVNGKTSSLTTGPSGTYLFLAVPAGNRSFTYSASGFATKHISIRVYSGMATTRNVTLRHNTKR